MVWELDHLLDYHDDGRLTRNQYVTELKDLVARHPGFIDGHAHLAFALLEQDKPKLALGAGLADWRWERRRFRRTSKARLSGVSLRTAPFSVRRTVSFSAT